MKNWYESKTFWFNALYLVLAVAALFGFSDYKPSSDVLEWAAVGGSVINLVLRYISTKSIKPLF